MNSLSKLTALQPWLVVPRAALGAGRQAPLPRFPAPTQEAVLGFGVEGGKTLSLGRKVPEMVQSCWLRSLLLAGGI